MPDAGVHVLEAAGQQGGRLTQLEAQRARAGFERVNGRPLVAACPPSCSCRGVPEVEERDDLRREELAGEPALAGR